MQNVVVQTRTTKTKALPIDTNLTIARDRVTTQVETDHELTIGIALHNTVDRETTTMAEDKIALILNAKTTIEKNIVV